MRSRPKRSWRRGSSFSLKTAVGAGLWLALVLGAAFVGWAQDSTSTTVDCTPNPVVVGQATTCTATVRNLATAADPTGTVTFSTSGSGTFNPGTGSCTLDVGTLNDGQSSCSVTYTPTAVGTGTHTITADYTPDPGFLASSGTFDLTVNKADTTTTITSDSPDPSVINEGYTVAVTVTVDAPGSGTPTGTVTVDDGDGNSCVITLVGGSGSCVLTSTSQGTKTLTAIYGGDADFNGSSGTASHQVNPRQTQTTVSCSPDPVVPTQDSTCTATVTDVSPGTPSAPSGSVTFSLDTTNSDGSGSFPFGNTCTLTSISSSASECSVIYRPSSANNNVSGSPGVHKIDASYGGSSVHAASSDPDGYGLTVNPRRTQTTVSCSPNPADGGSTVTCTATVTDTDPDGTPSTPQGTVSFSSSGTGTFSSSSCTLDLSGQCSVQYTPAAGSDGTHTITASYGGSTVHDTSNGTTDLAVDDTAPTISHTVGTPQYPSGCTDHPDCFVTGGTTLSVSVTDPTVNGVTSGLASCTVTVTPPSGPAQNPTCTISGSSANSSFTLDGLFPGGPDGEYTVTVDAQDNVGNTAATYTFRVYRDDTPPTIADPVHTNTICYPAANCDAPPETVQADTYVKALDQASPFVAASTFAYPSVDDGTGSGVQGCTLSGTQSDGAYTAGTNFRIASGDGPKSFSLTCQDNLGNSSTNTSPTLNVDDTPPTITGPLHTNTTCDPVGNCDAPPEFVSVGVYVKALTQGSPFVPASTFKYDVADGGSGLPGGQCIPGLSGTQQNGTYTPGADFNVASGDGRKTFSIACDDNLGNRATNTSPEVIVDDTPPTITPSIPGSPTWPVGCQGGPPNCYVNSLTTLRFTVVDPDAGTDPGSGFTGPNSGCTITVTGPGPNSPPCTVLPGDNDYTLINGGFATDGVYTNYAEATDDLGNYARSADLVVVLDNTPPQIGKDIPGAPTYLGGSPPGTECEGDPGTDCYVSSITTLRVTIVEPPAGTEPGSGLNNCTIDVTGQHYGNAHDPGCTEGNNDFTLPASLKDDRYQITVPIVQDNLGNTNFDNSLLEVILDNTPPTIAPPVHLNKTCWPLDRCDAPPEVITDGTWVKAQSRGNFDPSNPHLPTYLGPIERSRFEYPTLFDPDIAPGLPGSGLLDCTLSGGTDADGLYVAGTDFSFLPGDGTRTFRLDCRDNLSYSIPVNTSFDDRTLNVDDTPPVASFVTAGPRYDDPTDGTIFVKTTTVITPVLTDAGVGVDLNGYTGDPMDGPPGNPPCLQNIDQDAALTLPCLTPFTFPPPDRDHHFWIARPDKLGNVAESHFVFIVDDTPPAVRLIAPEEHGQYLLRERVPVRWEATDDVSFFGPQESPFLPPGVEPRGSGIAEVIATVPNGHPIDTASVGAKIFTLTVTDNLGHTTTVTVTYLVVYDFFLDPALEEALARGLEVGDEVSLAFRLRDAHGAVVPDAEPVIALVDPETGEVVRDFRPHNRARFDAETGFYTFAFSTEGLAPGEYEIWVQPGDTTTRKIQLVVK